MRINLATHGGWTGRFAAPQAIDTAALPARVAEQGAALVAAAAQAAAVAPGTTRQAQAPEAQSYTITIDADGRSTTVKTSDTDEDPARRALLEWVHAHLAG